MTSSDRARRRPRARARRRGAACGARRADPQRARDTGRAALRARRRPPMRRTTCRSRRSSPPAWRPRSRPRGSTRTLADERSTLAAVLGSTQDAVLMVNEEGVSRARQPAVRGMLGLVPESDDGRPDVQSRRATSRCGAFYEERRAGRDGAAAARRAHGPGERRVGDHAGTASPSASPRCCATSPLLKELEQMKSDFVNTVSHDLKNPIMVIAGTADLLLDRPDEARYRERCERIRAGLEVHDGSGHRPPRPRQDRGGPRHTAGADRPRRRSSASR